MYINWVIRRLGFHCHCKKCVVDIKDLRIQKRGKFWQAQYGESAKQFKQRYEKLHRGE